ncbi:MAG: histidine phosphatase family protein [bacterium]
MFNRKCKIIFIRHGSTIYTDQNRLYDTDDYPPLNAQGRLEIEKINNWLKNSNQKIDRIYSSSALRSVQSARIIAQGLKKNVDVVEGLLERRPGIWGGLTFGQIENKYPDMLEEYHKNPSTFWPEGGETTISVNERVKTVIDKIVEENLYKRIVIVTHGGVIQSAISSALGVAPELQGRLYIPTGSATQINYYHDWQSLVFSAYTSV